MNKIQIPDVTLIAVDCTDRISGTINALKICSRAMEFGEVVLLSDKKPENLPSFVTYKEIEEIKNIDNYNYFIFLELYKYFNTSHVLLCQDHAYILHPEVWDDGWLKYDWIGAVWGVRENSYIGNNGERVRNGNGGFSLRSKKISQLPDKMGWELRQEQGFYNEDGNYTCYYRKEMLEQGIKYAPVEIASVFSYETPVLENNYGRLKTFGFHRHLPRGDR